MNHVYGTTAESPFIRQSSLDGIGECTETVIVSEFQYRGVCGRLGDDRPEP